MNGSRKSSFILSIFLISVFVYAETTLLSFDAYNDLAWGILAILMTILIALSYVMYRILSAIDNAKEEILNACSKEKETKEIVKEIEKESKENSVIKDEEHFE